MIFNFIKSNVLFVSFRFKKIVCFQSLSRIRDGILYAELDLNMCNEMREQLGLHKSQRLSYYKDSWLHASNLSFSPQII